MDAATASALGSAAVAVAAAAYFGWAPRRVARRDASVERFRQVRGYLKTHLPDLVTAAVEGQGAPTEYTFSLLTKPGWIPAEPLALEDVVLSLRPSNNDESTRPAYSKLSRYWPSLPAGRIGSYSEAIDALDRPGIWENRTSYRLLKVEHHRDGALDAGLELEFGTAKYFEGFDTTESLGYETAVRHLRGRGAHSWRGPYRRWLSDPFDFSRRCALPGINVLTLRLHADGAYFFLHRRSGSEVALATNSLHVAPAGAFQPSSDLEPAYEPDLKIWHTIVREYAEEFLGVPEADGSGGALIDYERPPFSRISRARQLGQVKPYFLGLGLDPLTWKPEFCTVCVWDAAAFDKIFRVMVPSAEAVLLVGSRRRGVAQGIEFSEGNVRHYAQDPVTDPVSQACLSLAWQWRDRLGLPVS